MGEWLDRRNREIVRLWNRQVPVGDIARSCHCSVNTVYVTVERTRRRGGEVERRYVFDAGRGWR